MLQKKRIVLIGLIFVGLMHLYITSINPDGHDYGVYSENMKSDTSNDLGFSWALMKIFTNFFGNPRGLYVLSFWLATALYFVNAYKCEDVDHAIAFTIFFFTVYPIWYLTSGVLRNLIGLCLISFFIRYKPNYHFWEAWILVNTHIPTFLIFVGYHFYKKEIKRIETIIIAGACWVWAVCAAIIFEGNALRSIQKVVTLTIMKVKRPLDFYLFDWQGFNVGTYAAIVLIVGIIYVATFAMTHEKINYFWAAMLFIPFLPLFTYKIQIRFLLFTILPLMNLPLSDKTLTGIGLISGVVRLGVWLL